MFNPIKKGKDGLMDMGKNRDALTQLAQSGDARRLMELLSRDGGMEKATKSASVGDISQLMGMVQQLMHSEEGAALVDSISKQAKDAGIDKME